MSEHTIDMPKIESAIHPQRILQLFMRQKQYFQDLTQLDGSKIYLLAYLLGVFLVMDRIDTQIIKIQKANYQRLLTRCSDFVFDLSN